MNATPDAGGRPARSALLDQILLFDKVLATTAIYGSSGRLRDLWEKLKSALEAAGLAAGDRPSLDPQPWRHMDTAPQDGRFFIALLANHRLSKIHWDTKYTPHDWATPEGFYVKRPIGWIPLPTEMAAPWTPEQLAAVGARPAPQEPDHSKVTRFELIGPGGRAYSRRNCGVTCSRAVEKENMKRIRRPSSTTVLSTRTQHGLHALGIQPDSSRREVAMHLPELWLASHVSNDGMGAARGKNFGKKSLAEVLEWLLENPGERRG